MEFGRNEGRNWRASAQSHPGDIAAEKIVFPLINMVMTGVPGRRDRAHFKSANPDDVQIVDNSDALLGDRREPPPQPFHVVAIDARRRFDESCRIDQVRRSSGMDVNRRAEFRETPGGAGVIEMDVAKENVPHIFGGKSSLLEFRGYVLEGRFRTGVEQNDSIIRLKRGGGDDASAGPAAACREHEPSLAAKSRPKHPRKKAANSGRQ